MLFRDGVDRVHFTAHARVMHGDDGLCPRRDGFLDPVFIEVHRVRADVREYDLRAAHGERVRRGNERERGHDDFVAGPDVREVRRHFERVRAAGGEERLCRARVLFEPGVAFLIELTVAADLAAFDGRADVFELAPSAGRLVKRNADACHGGEYRYLECPSLKICYISEYDPKTTCTTPLCFDVPFCRFAFCADASLSGDH